MPDMQAHIPILETTDEGKQALLMGLEYLVNIAFVDDEEVRRISYLVYISMFNASLLDLQDEWGVLTVCWGGEQVFKITLEYWNFFVPDVYSSVSTLDANAPFAFGGPVAPSNRKALYAAVLSRLRLLMISRMAKPEEVSAQCTACWLAFQVQAGAS